MFLGGHARDSLRGCIVQRGARRCTGTVANPSQAALAASTSVDSVGTYDPGCSCTGPSSCATDEYVHCTWRMEACAHGRKGLISAIARLSFDFWSCPCCEPEHHARFVRVLGQHRCSVATSSDGPQVTQSRPSSRPIGTALALEGRADLADSGASQTFPTETTAGSSGVSRAVLCSIGLQSRRARLLASFRKLVRNAVAPSEVDLVGRLAIERRVGDLRVLFGTMLNSVAPARMHRIPGVRTSAGRLDGSLSSSTRPSRIPPFLRASQSAGSPSSSPKASVRRAPESDFHRADSHPACEGTPSTARRASVRDPLS